MKTEEIYFVEAKMRWAGVWDIVLTEDEMKLIYDGAEPASIQPDHFIFGVN